MLKSKLKKLVAFKKRGREPDPMGNCAGSKTGGERTHLQSTAAGATAGVDHSSSSYTHGEFVLKVLVEVNQLSSQDGGLQWQPVLESLVPLSVHCIQVDQDCMFKLEATGVDGQSFSVEIKVPGTKLQKTSAKFVQWTDEENGKTWGLSFMCESDTDNFFRSCSPSITFSNKFTSMTSHPSSPLDKDTPPSNESPALLIPVPTTHSSSPLQPITINKDMSTEYSQEHSHSNGKTSTGHTPCEVAHSADGDDRPLEQQDEASESFDISARSEGEASSDSEVLELYQPSSPFKKTEEFMLPDIMEETEEAETDSVGNTLDSSFRAYDQSSLHSSLEDGELDIKETSFNEEMLPGKFAFDKLPCIEESDPNPNLDPPMLPVSPPPGPLLSPEMVDVVADAHQPPPYRGGYEAAAAAAAVVGPEKHFRHSVAGALDDIPPPLPLTQPPGKMISPRHSMFMDLADLSADWKKPGPVNMGHLVSEMNKMASREDQSTSAEQLIRTPCENGELETPSVETLPPPPLPQDYPDGDFNASDPSIMRQRLGSYHLKAFEPPKEFSDSEFQDTDTHPSPLPVPAATQPDFNSNEQENFDPSLVTLTQKVDSSITGTSDEQLTENSGSVGLKTFASSGSENSASCNDNNTTDSGKDVSNAEPPAAQLASPDMAEDLEQSYLSPLPTVAIIRKTGWLEIKTVLGCKNRRVAPIGKSKRKWKKYWANLKRSTLFLYECDEQSTLPELETMHSDLKLDLESSLAHAVHDHVKRDHLFCLSTSSGNTYYMQTTNQAEVEDWITCMHCAAAVASTQRDKDHSLPLLMRKVEELNRKIEKETQLKNLTALNLTAALESTTKSMASDKLVECSENLESYKVEHYRIRCYIASLQGTELPNPQSLLGSISKPTKSLLGRIGTFSVASLHAVVSSRHNHVSTNASSVFHTKTTKLKEKLSTLPRSPGRYRQRRGSLDESGSNVSSLMWGKSAKAKTSSLPPGLKGSVSLRSFEISGPYPKLPLSPDKTTRRRKFSLEMDSAFYSSPTGTPASKRSMEISGPYLQPPKSLAKQHSPLNTEEERTGDEMEDYLDGGSPSMSLLNVVSVRIPSSKHSAGQVVQLTMRNDATARQVLCTVCEKFKFNVSDHFLRLKLVGDEGIKYFIPHNDDVIVEQYYSEVEICQKSLETVTLSTDKIADSKEKFGLILVPEWDVNTEIDLQSVLVQGVKEGSVADRKLIRRGDEVALINGKSVMELGWVEVERLMSGQEVALTVRTCKVDAPLSHFANNTIVDSLICPAPPTSHPEISREMLKSLTIPKPNASGGDPSLHDDISDLTDLTQDQIDHLLKDTHEVSKLLRTWQSQQTEEPTSVPWSTEDKLRKRISDLIETERDYVRLLNALVDRYFEPLRHEAFLSRHEVRNLTGNMVELVKVQNSLLNELKKAWQSESESGTPDAESLKLVVLQVARIFLKHVEHFKKYSSFCASHQIVKQLLAAGEENRALIEFFRARNPTTNPSLNVDSLLTKPIVRISRYPLFLHAILDNTSEGSEESVRLKEVIKEMGVVADHMNEMQRLCETFWPLMYTLSNNSKLFEIGVAVQITDLKYHGDVTWLNPSIEGLSKGWKKGQGPRMTVFVFRSSIVLICLEKKHKRKETKGIHEIRLEAEDVKYREIIPAVESSVNKLPDSDGVTNMWRLQHHKTRISSGVGLIYFFRSKSAEDKRTVTDFIQHSIHEQQLLYGSSPNTARATSPTSISPGGSPYQRHWRGTSPSPSALSHVTPSAGAGYGTGTASDTDHD